uniref:Uncharacterized protein n=1 Tax=Anguilla anguilla TaxID=7936 RepID=A0A0E9X563_ANGAN
MGHEIQGIHFTSLLRYIHIEETLLVDIGSVFKHLLRHRLILNYFDDCTCFSLL